jgi:hypothetical protein
VSALVVVLAVTNNAYDDYVTRRGMSGVVTTDDMGPAASDDDGASIINDTLAFTFYRTGYDVLDQFLPEKSTVLKYKFLSTYDGIVEPYGTMHLLPLSFDNYTNYDYKFTICADEQSANSSSVECKHGDLKADGSETPFAIACDPYDTFKVQVTEYYTDDAPVFAGKTTTFAFVHQQPVGLDFLGQRNRPVRARPQGSPELHAHRRRHPDATVDQVGRL